MNADRWQQIARLCFGLALVALASAWVGYGNCVWELSDAMTRELNPLTEQHLREPLARALEPVELIPAPLTDRVGLAHPVCYGDNSIGDNGLSYAMFVFLIFVGLFARNQSRLPVQPTPGGRRHGTEVGRRNEPVPDEIEVNKDLMSGLTDRDREILDAVGDVNVRDESLMLYLQRKVNEGDGEEESTYTPRDIDGYFCPPGYHDKPIVYVDPGHAAASDEIAGEDPVGNKDRPFSTLGGAIEMARQLLEESKDGVMIRVMPGVYHAALEVPDKVVICNHRMPADGTPRARLQWLTNQSVDAPDNVTILAPQNAQFAIQFEPGARQGIFGCHIAGRENVKQAGIVAVNCRGLAIVNCSIEGFIGGGIRLQDAGTNLPGGAVIVFGCRLHRNEARLGGAIYGERSAVSVADSVLERNKALTGGAIYLCNPRAPLFITSSRIAHNRAQLEESPKLDVEETELDEWSRMDGLGGGVYVLNGKLKAVGAEFVENGASVAGGGVALLNSKAVFETDDENRARFARNRSRLGAGIVTIGWPDARATLKCTDVLFRANHAVFAGGGMLALGISTVQIFESEFVENQVTAKDGFGAGAAAWMGGELLAAEVEITDNTSAGFGAGIGAVNARVSLKRECVIRGNSAGDSGGGIYAFTTSSSVARELVRKKQLKVPFAITIENTKIIDNVSASLGGGLRGGNDLGMATLPIGFKIAEDVRFQLNRTKSQKENGDDIWVTWAGKVKGTDRDRHEKLVLR